ncbi:MAG: PQQ-binding-like beta-propeller repeat protein [Polyangiales bacterium]
MPIDEHWLSPKQQPTPRASATILAKGAPKSTTHIECVADGSFVVAHHEGLADSLGGLAHRDARGAVLASRTGAFGPIDVSRSRWLAAGPLHHGEHAALCVLEPATLETVESFALARPFAWLSDATLVAHTPPPNATFAKKTYAYTRLPGYRAEPSLLARTKLPETPGLVAFDLATGEARLLVEASVHDAFHYAAVSRDGSTLFAATRYRRVVAVRIADGALLWELPAGRDSARFAVLSLALSPDQTQLVCAGSGSPHDCIVLDAATGVVRAQHALRSALDGARLVRKRASTLDAIAVHPEGHFAVATNVGVIIVVRRDGRISAFEASSSPVRALAFSTDARTLVSGGHDESLRAWPFDP